MSHTAAAALPLAGLTALQALREHAAVQPGEDVLVHGGAGGVGALTVQLTAILGARVTATIRSDAGESVLGLGARRVIDVRGEAFDDSGPYDVVVDTVGGQTLRRSFGVLRRGGRLVTLSAPPPEELADETASRQHFSSSRRIGSSSPNSRHWSTVAACRCRSRRLFRSPRAGRPSKAVDAGTGARARPSLWSGPDVGRCTVGHAITTSGSSRPW